jgi:Mce-associated membrane protein
MTDELASPQRSAASIALLARRALATPPGPAQDRDEVQDEQRRKATAVDDTASSAPTGSTTTSRTATSRTATSRTATSRTGSSGDAVEAGVDTDLDLAVRDTVTSPALAETAVTDATGATGADTPDLDTADGRLAQPSAATSETDSGSSTATATSRHPQLVNALIAGVAALALVFAVISAVIWWQAGHGGDQARAEARDAVLVQARLDIATLNTLDYKNVNAGLAQWSAVTAGSLHSQIAQANTASKKIIQESKTVTKAVVLAAAVTSLDLRTGTASVIASVQVTKTPDTGASVVDRNRVSATLSLTNGTWRMTNLQGVLVQLS